MHRSALVSATVVVIPQRRMVGSRRGVGERDLVGGWNVLATTEKEATGHRLFTAFVVSIDGADGCPMLGSAAGLSDVRKVLFATCRRS